MKNYETIKKFFEENEDAFNEAIEELDSYNGYLSDSRYYLMEEINDIFTDIDPMDILARAFYGYDEDTSYIDNTNHTIYGPFNPNREYFYYNGYGNLVSSDYKDYSSYLDNYFIDELIENIDNLYLSDEVLELLEDIKK